MIAKWIIVGFLTLGALLSVANVGKPRKPITAGQAVTIVVINAALIASMVIWWR